MKRFLSDELAKKEAAIMKDLMHPHVVLLLGYARHKSRLNLFSQSSPNILLQIKGIYETRSRIYERIWKLM